MFDNLKDTISAAESIFSDIQWNRLSAEESVQYWQDRVHESMSAETGEVDGYALSKLNEANIKVQMYEAIEKTVTSFVRQSLK